MHACTKETLGCHGELARNEYGCELCECAGNVFILLTINNLSINARYLISETPIPCPAHACTKENLDCLGELAVDENGCKLCKCAGINIRYI